MTRLATENIQRVRLHGTRSLRFASFRCASLLRLLRLPACCRFGARLTPCAGATPCSMPTESDFARADLVELCPEIFSCKPAIINNYLVLYIGSIANKEMHYMVGVHIRRLV